MRTASSDPGVLLLDADARAALGVVRDLGRRGVRVVAASSDRWAMAGYSRWASQRVVHADPATDADLACKQILAAAGGYRAEVLLPVSDAGWQLYYRFQERFDAVLRAVPNPGPALYNETRDKSKLAELCRRTSTPQPRTLVLERDQDPRHLPADWPYPSLLKPLQGRSGEGIRPVHSAGDVEQIRAGLTERLLLQECVDGEDVEITVLCDRGRIVAASTYRGLRAFPRRYGPPAAAETAPADDVAGIAARLLETIEYHGVAHLDIRRNARDGIPKVLDFNARLAGTDEISIRSGIPFAWMLYQMALGRELGAAPQQKQGVRFQWLCFHDLSWALSGTRKLQDFATVLTEFRAHKNVDWRDPAPQAAQFLSGYNKRRRTAPRHEGRTCSDAASG